MKICKVKECNNKIFCREYCKRHYNQLWRYNKIFERTIFDRNEIINCGNYYEICLYSGQGEQKEIARAKIDKEYLDKVKDYKWGLQDKGYVRATINGKNVLLHQLILGKKKGFEIDHINHDTLDNRKQNLRFTTHSQNCMNRKVKGIYWHKPTKKYLAQISVNYKRIHLGLFINKQDAQNIRRQAEQKYFGKFAFKA